MNTRKIIGIISVLVMTAMLLLSACSVPVAIRTDKPVPSETDVALVSVTEEPIASQAETPIASETVEPTVSETETPKINDGSPNTIGIYKRINSSESYQFLTKIVGKWVKGKDICDLYAIASQEKSLKGSSFKNIFESSWHKYPDADKCKIGYCLVFTLNSSEVITMTIRSPKNAPKDKNAYFYQYIEVYLYDSLVPKNGPKRMHLVESKINKNTIITSIKLTAGKKFSEVATIKLTAFIYKDNSDFDPASGNYIGNTSYEITIS